jgi:hypothetical protein
MFSPIAFAAGALSWSLAEYSLHRFWGHAPRPPKDGAKRRALDGDFGSEHQAHHTDTRYFSPTKDKLRVAAVALPVIAAAASLLAGPRRGLAFAAGFGAAYAGYEILHRRIHTHAPRGPYSRWALRHHLHHHFTSPREYHGVTSPLWDVVFGTHGERQRIRVPRRHAPTWLLDPQGDVRPEHGSDYELPGCNRVPAEAEILSNPKEQQA